MIAYYEWRFMLYQDGQLLDFRKEEIIIRLYMYGSERNTITITWDACFEIETGDIIFTREMAAIKIIRASSRKELIASNVFTIIGLCCMKYLRWLISWILEANFWWSHCQDRVSHVQSIFNMTFGHSEIRILIQQQDLYTLLSESIFYVEDRLTLKKRKATKSWM